MAEDGRARAELTLSQPATVQQAYVLEPIDDQPARLVVDLITTTPDDFAARAAADLANSQSRQPPDATAPSSEAAVAPPSSAEPASSSVAELPSSSVAPPPSSSERLIRRCRPSRHRGATNDQRPRRHRGGSRPLIVLDPGHGGIDNGASAPNGIHEKNIIARLRAEAARPAGHLRPLRCRA